MPVRPTGYASGVETFLKQTGYRNLRNIINSKTKDEFTPLHLASRKGHVNAVSVLLNFGADIYGRGSYDMTALHIAAENGKLESVKLLVDSMESVDIGDRNDATALHLAAWKGHRDVAQFLLSRKANLSALVKDTKETPLHLVCGSVSFQQIRKQLVHETKGSDLNLNKSSGHISVVDLLLNSNANVYLKDRHNRTPLHWAAMAGPEEIVCLFVQHQEDLNARDSGGYTALALAIQNGRYSVVSTLLEHGADPTLPISPLEGLPVHLACTNGKSQIVELLLNNSPKTMNEKTAHGQKTPLHIAVIKNHKETVRCLLRHQVDLSAKDKNQQTALHLAASKENIAMLRLLLDNGADPSIRDKYGKLAQELTTSPPIIKEIRRTRRK